MDQRKIPSVNNKFGILLDTKSINEDIKTGNRYLESLIKYDNVEGIEIVRMPLKGIVEDLNQIKEIIINYEGEEIKSIEIGDEIHGKTIFFGYKIKDIKKISSIIYNKENFTQEELIDIIMVFIQATWNWDNECNILLTSNDILLKNRLWFENHFPGMILNIMTIEEAANYIDLHLKYNKKYMAASRYYFNKFLWYWLSMRLKLPNFNVGDEFIDSLANRVYYSIMAIDEIGIQYYLGSSNDTLDTMLYHFGYYISLITGVFDNLALKTNIYLSINEKDLRKISLTNDDFLKNIKDKNQAMRDLIAKNKNFINLIYCFRTLIIHREGLKKTRFSYDSDIKWKSNMIIMDGEVVKRISLLNNVKLKYDPFTIWGCYEMTEKETYIEPYNFSKQTLKVLIEFVNKYLILFGYASSIEEQKRKGGDFTRRLIIFEKNNLGI